MNLPAWSECVTEVKDFLNSKAIPYKSDFNLKYETYFKSGGKAKIYVFPHDVETFSDFLRFLIGKEIPYKVVGLTTNVLFINEIDYGVIVTTKNLTFLNFNKDSIEVGCGYALADLVRVALVNGYGGIEGLEGVPGTIGGGIVMNAGAYGYSISDYLVNVKCVNESGELMVLDKVSCEFNHRNSVFKSGANYIVLSAIFQLPTVDRRKSADKIEVFHMARHAYQEFAFPNLGSLFSLRKDFYRELMKSSLSYYTLCIVLKLIYKNPIAKFIFRKRPNNIIFNKLAMRFISKSSGRYQPSVKSMNILVNDGVATTEDLLIYINSLRKKISDSGPIENEIVLSPIFRIDKDLQRVTDNFLNEAK